MNNSPWFKNPWVWLIIALPMSAVIGGIITIIITNANQPDMVVDDYYKKGKAINQSLLLTEKAQQLGIELSVQVMPNRIAIKSNKSFPALKAQLIHSTLKKKDFETVLTPNANGELTGTFEHNIDGKWEIVIKPMDESWKKRITLGLPTQTWINF